MRYDVTYLLRDEERTDRIDALDAASAAAAAGAMDRRPFDRFELLAVQLIDAPTPSGSTADVGPRVTDAPAAAAGAGNRSALPTSDQAAKHPT